MTKDEAIAKLQAILDTGREDLEIAHLDADDILCELLCSLDCEDVVYIWAKIPKWYA